MFDTIERIDGALLHHGNTNKRVYMMQADHGNWNLLIDRMKDLAQQRKYEKIVSRVPEAGIESFQSEGYKVEAKIPGLYNGKTAGYFLAEYLNEERSSCAERKLKIIQSVKSIALAAGNSSDDPYFALPDGLEIRKLAGDDELAELARLNAKAFRSYPFPIHEVPFLKGLLRQSYEFYGLYEEGRLIVASLVRINPKESNVEIVDFSTDSNYKGQNLSYYLVQEIKEDFKKRDFKTLYSALRATSYGLNITFSKHGFSFGGTLLNNAFVDETLESMNVWYLPLN